MSSPDLELSSLDSPIIIKVSVYWRDMVKASDWQSFDRRFEPYLRAFMEASLWCGLGCSSLSDGIIHRTFLYWYDPVHIGFWSLLAVLLA